ncbi:hypothetical protein B0H10DRAFT_1919025 [Mycena sp. CBHHK59/15]|nr:hypothetical protein B0H10DRAFT_1919025 [Mycena sp. CBHHK59/15]
MSAPTPAESYLVVGGGSFLGRTIVDLLVERGDAHVSIFDGQPLSAEQTALLPQGTTVPVFVGDITDADAVSNIVKTSGATCIFHTGMVSNPLGVTSLASGPPPLTPQERDRLHKELAVLHTRVNLEGTRNLLSASLAHGVTKLVYTSNADIFFDGTNRPGLTEDAAPYPLKCFFENLECKLQGERMVLSFNGIDELRTTAIRPAGYYGPEYAIGNWLKAVQVNPQLVAAQIGDNTNLVDHTYVLNAAHALVLAADRLAPAHPKHASVAGRAFFVSDGVPQPIYDFTRTLWSHVMHAPPPRNDGAAVSRQFALFTAGVADFFNGLRGKPQEMKKNISYLSATRWCDISLARDALDYVPLVSHDEGIRRTAEWWLQTQLKLCKEKGNASGSVEGPPPYNPNEGVVATEKSPFF